MPRQLQRNAVLFCLAGMQRRLAGMASRPHQQVSDRMRTQIDSANYRSFRDLFPESKDRCILENKLWTDLGRKS